MFVSAHSDVIMFFLERGEEIEILAPCEKKETWRARLKFRYYQNPTLPNLKALRDFEQNYDGDMAYYKELEEAGVKVRWIRAKVKTNLEEILE